MKLVTIIMAGGSGRRFWPLSRESRAKQSLALFSERTLLAQTIERIQPLCDDVTVVSSVKQKKSIDQDVRAFKNTGVIYEPSGRNTAPCIMLALHAIKAKNREDCAVLVLPADHFIQDSESFRKTVSKGVKYLSEHTESIGTIGIEPAYPETGFGYIRKNKMIKDGIFSVKSFEEKPALEKAKLFVESGNYLWNAGIFLFSLDTMLNEFRTVNPDIYETVVKINSFSAIDADLYNSVRSISFDYAIMEKTKRPVFTIPGDFGWSDVGNWLAYYELLEKDESGNAAKGKAHFIDCVNSLVFNQTDKAVFLFNRNCELIIAIDDVILSASLNDHQELRKISEYLARIGKTELL